MRTDPNYPEADYFVGVLLARNEKITPIENGIIGYFAVDRRTASVTTMSDFTEVKGKELARVQEWMRREHNIQTQ